MYSNKVCSKVKTMSPDFFVLILHLLKLKGPNYTIVSLQLTSTLGWVLSLMCFIWTVPRCQHSGWVGGWRGGVVVYLLSEEKLFSWDASGRFACIRATEGKSSPFLSLRALSACTHRQRQTHAHWKISRLKVICKKQNAKHRPLKLKMSITGS